jgi:hypothetical protein
MDEAYLNDKEGGFREQGASCHPDLRNLEG